MQKCIICWANQTLELRFVESCSAIAISLQLQKIIAIARSYNSIACSKSHLQQGIIYIKWGIAELLENQKENVGK